MINILYTIAALWVLFYFTLFNYIAVMGIKPKLKHIKKNKLDYYSLMPFVLYAFGADVLLNIAYGSIRFLELPKEITLSARIKRLRKGDGWRAKAAERLRLRYLEPFDEGHAT